MKKILIFIATIFILNSCNTKEYKYKIFNPKYLNYNNSAYFLTDTIQWKHDTAFYTNSDKTEVIISIDSLKDCKIDTLK